MFLIPAGRLGDLWYDLVVQYQMSSLNRDSGPKRMWMAGYIIIAASALGSGFCQTRVQFDVLRGLAGLGVACSRK